jgi:hypothetical protein
MTPLGKIMIFGGLGTAVMALLFSRDARAATGWGGLSPKEPPLPPRSYITTAERDERFGPLEWFHSPSSTNPERVVITNEFPRNMLVRETFHELPGSPTIDIHREAAFPLHAVLEELDRRDMLGLIRSFDGVYNPRLVRGSTTNLSSHAYGTSIDVNARENPMGGPPTDDQRRLASVFEEHGWYWGDRFSRRDPMHFEWIGG